MNSISEFNTALPTIYTSCKEIHDNINFPLSILATVILLQIGCH